MEEILQTSHPAPEQLEFPFMDVAHIEQPADWVDVPPGKTPNVCITTIPPQYTYDPALDPDVLSWPSTCATPQASDPQDVGHKT